MEWLYKFIAGFYDLLDVIYFRKNDRNPRQAILEFTNGQATKILDICTGTAANALLVAKERPKAKVIGVDLSTDMLKMAKGKIRKSGLPNVEVLQRDATKTHFKSDSFEVVIMALVLHETPTAIAEKMLLEAKRVLKPNGSLIVLEWEQPKNLLKKVLFLPILLLEPKGFRKFLRMDKKRYFKEHGWRVIRQKHCDYSCVYQLKAFEK